MTDTYRKAKLDRTVHVEKNIAFITFSASELGPKTGARIDDPFWIQETGVADAYPKEQNNRAFSIKVDFAVLVTVWVHSGNLEPLNSKFRVHGIPAENPGDIISYINEQ